MREISWPWRINRQYKSENKEGNGLSRKREKIITGIFQSSRSGRGFVTVEGLDKDLMVQPENTMHAFYGDTVECRIIHGQASAGRTSGRTEARVIHITGHSITTLVGTYFRERGMGTVQPDNTKIPTSIIIPAGQNMNAADGHKVVVRITDYGNDVHGPEGKVTEILGHMDDPGVDVLSIIRAYNLPGEFPQAVRNEVRTLPELVHYDPEDTPHRLDLRKVTTVTIDGLTSKDLDDAISVERRDGEWILGIHIADVAQYVQEGSRLDQEALERGTSIYLADRVIPMLPHELSNGICSLNQGEDRYTLSCIMHINDSGKVTDSCVRESVIRSDARLSYTGVEALLKNKDDSEIVRKLQEQGIRGVKTHTLTITRMLRRAARLAKLLYRKRQERGSIDFDSTECEIDLDGNGRPVDIRPHESNDATNMIEDFMLMANETVARTFRALEVPFVYRTHAEPAADKMDQLNQFLKGYGYKLNRGGSGVHPGQIRQLLESIHGKPEEAAINQMALRSMMRAEYTTYCGGHFGLALESYCHFTSPIRRYPDLQIHRIIKEYLHGQLNKDRILHYDSILTYVAKHSSDMEKRADEAERETDKQKKAEYLGMHLGEEYEGMISSVTAWGMYVALPNTCEGLVPVRSLTDDYYIFDEIQDILVGERTGRVYSLGQKVKVQVAAVDLIARTVDFVLADESSRMERDRGTKPGSGSSNRLPLLLDRSGRPPEKHRRKRRHSHHMSGRHGNVKRDIVM